MVLNRKELKTELKKSRKFIERVAHKEKGNTFYIVLPFSLYSMYRR